MTARAMRTPVPAGRIRLNGATLLLALAVMTLLGAPWTERLQSAWFDAHQMLAPRTVAALPVTVVAIDQKSLQAQGQWPWPRDTLARLVDAIQQAQPSAIGLDFLMPEADALSPDQLLARLPSPDQALQAALSALPTNDATLAAALAQAPTVLALAGTPDATGMALRAAPVTVRAHGGQALTGLTEYGGALTNVDALNAQAKGWGLISADATRGIVRRVPLVASIQGTLVPTFAVEMLRVAQGATTLRLSSHREGLQSVGVGQVTVPTEADGSLRIFFAGHLPDRFVSAVDVLQGHVDPARLKGKLVLVGPTAIGLHDLQGTPLGETMSASEIQAELIENLLERSWLHRPAWANAAEAAWLLLIGTVLLWQTPRWRPARSAQLLAATVGLPVLLAFGLFRTQGLLFDAATPGLYLLLLYGLLLGLTLAESTRQRRQLEGVMQAQRESTARIAGELAAAERIQTSNLPRADLLQGDPRIDLHATLTPAREVGGDVYDYFMLDDRHLFLLVGDVAGKGLSASIFMAVSKAVIKGAVLRAPTADIGSTLCAANAEVSRDNGEMLFVTAFAAILDLTSGELVYCNAGHDNPWRMQSGDAQARRITDGDGPPLCAMPEFAYHSARCKLAPGEALWLLTDGVGEAQDGHGALFGTDRVQRFVEGLPATVAAAQAVGRLQAEVLAHAAGAEPHDDLTILMLRWHGPAAVHKAPAAASH